MCTKLGTPVYPRNLLRTFYDLTKKAKVPKIWFHDLRHTVVTLMLSSNTNPKIVKEIPGHSDIRVTFDINFHISPSIHKETTHQYGNMIFGSQLESKEKEVLIAADTGSSLEFDSESLNMIQ
ncbi:tyrosine-type recombinase/integrase [Paenibacillus glucanolyticus]|uniref:tyrosine-type recombinase/integrase n=1 Tax=Paenibacillus glucanolyticus TaxID=59843 RepID=UPI0034CF802D